MAQQLEQPSEQPGHGSDLRTQRMTADESRAVIALWQQERVEQTGLTDKPAVPDVAEGLDITVEDVQCLLQEVRAKRLEEERALATEQELSQIRLAEEERKLAEIRRQRAELRREQAEAERRMELWLSQASAPGQKASLLSREDLINRVFLLGLVVLPFIYLILLFAFQK